MKNLNLENKQNLKNVSFATKLNKSDEMKLEVLPNQNQNLNFWQLTEIK